MKYSLVSFVGLVCLACAPLLRADGWDRRTVVTFHQSVEIPHVVLGPGTYVMKLVDLPSTRNVVQFSNAKETQVFATVIAIPAYRMEPTDHTVLTFEERQGNSPRALKTWFYPGYVSGEEFIYPKAELARTTSPPANLAPRLTTPAPETSRTEAKPASVTPAPPQPVEVAQAAPAPAPAPAAAPAPTPSKKQLPKTASDLPLLALVGIFSTSLGAILRTAER